MEQITGQAEGIWESLAPYLPWIILALIGFAVARWIWRTIRSKLLLLAALGVGGGGAAGGITQHFHDGAGSWWPF